MSSTGPMFGLIPTQPGAPGYSQDLRVRAAQVLNGTSLVEVILYSHLLLEQALDLRIQARFSEPGALENPKLARLTFAQKVTVYTGLYNPDVEQVALLQAVNRLRNRMAHTLTDLEKVTLECLPQKFGQTPLDVDRDDLAGTALGRVQAVFLWLAFFELNAIEGVTHLNHDATRLEIYFRPDES